MPDLPPGDGARVRGRTNTVGLLDQQEMGENTLKMSWLTPPHLEVAYPKHPGIDFQVVKSGEIDIFVRDLSRDEADTSK